MTMNTTNDWEASAVSSSAAIDSIHGWTFGPGSPLPGLLLIEIRDSEGRAGIGETFYLPRACWAVIEGLFAQHLLGRRLSELGSFFHTMKASLHRLVGIGAEYRALSALDVALWDLLAVQSQKPLREMLFTEAAVSIPVYNSCAGPQYTASASAPGEGSSDITDPRDDYGAWKRNAGNLARELITDGYSAMKLWPLDDLAKAIQGTVPTEHQLFEACTPLRNIRDEVGSGIDIMIDGHGQWTLDGAIAVARYCERFDLRWVEDLVLAHPVSNLSILRRQTKIPVLASEYLATEDEFRRLFDSNAVDIVMIDPTWAGGITNCMAVAKLAHQYSLPVSFHDCTGPATMMAGASMASAIPNHEIQEVARSFVHHVYPSIAESDARLDNGQLLLGSEAGLGLKLNPELNAMDGVTEFVLSGSVR